MTEQGTLVHSNGEEEIVKMQPSSVQKWTLSVVTALTMGCGALALDYHGMRGQWSDARPEIQKNSEWRIRGDRVTQSDLEAAVSKAGEESTRLAEQQNSLIAELINTNNNTNEQLLKVAQSLARIETQIEGLEKEQDRARDERQGLRDGG